MNCTTIQCRNCTMDISSDIVLYILSFAGAVDRIRFLRTCRRYYRSLMYRERIYDPVRSRYSPEGINGFRNACQDGEEQIITLHIEKKMASARAAVYECAIAGKAKLVEKYISRDVVKQMGISMTSLVL